MTGWNDLIGSDPRTITVGQMCIRAVFIFFAGMLLVRFGGRRTFGKTTSFDIVVAVILGSILSRAMTGNARFLPTLAAAAVLMALHFIIAKATFFSPWMGRIFKGGETELIKNGEIQREALRKTSMTEHDLLEAARLKGAQDLGDIQTAVLERNGAISIFRKKQS
jgi:uncharacterized membrane protein YcaP (DUF421 family)